MLRTDKDRLSYSEALKPPEGYFLERAVATTYSLDLETLIAAAIPLGLSENIDNLLRESPVCLLEALRRISQKLLVFCEAGQIKWPMKSNPLYGFLEDMIVEVKLPYHEKIHRYPSFHPKTWILCFQAENGERMYRVVVLSRNLTADHSWDVSASFDGNMTDRVHKASQHLAGFLSFLKKQIGSKAPSSREKKTLLDGLHQGLENVRFKTDDEDITEVAFLPLGIGESSYPIKSDALFISDFEQLAIMSPFLTGSIIRAFNERGGNTSNTSRTLLTRKTEFHKLKEKDINRFSVYSLKDALIDGEEYLSEDTEAFTPQKQDIHAKIYMISDRVKSFLYLGSMNASLSAVEHNVEFMARLQMKSQYMDASKLLRDFFGGDPDGKDNPFELLDISDLDKYQEETATDNQERMEQLIKKLCRLQWQARIHADENGRYAITVSVEPVEPEEFSVEVSPMNVQRFVPLSSVMEFAPLTLRQLSQFFVLKVGEGETEVSRVIMIPIDNMPSNRETILIQSILKDKRSFMAWFALSLHEDVLATAIEQDFTSKSGLYTRRGQPTYSAIYERMLKAVQNHRNDFLALHSFIEKIQDSEIVTEEFRQMYRTFRQALEG